MFILFLPKIPIFFSYNAAHSVYDFTKLCINSIIFAIFSIKVIIYYKALIPGSGTKVAIASMTDLVNFHIALKKFATLCKAD